MGSLIWPIALLSLALMVIAGWMKGFYNPATDSRLYFIMRAAHFAGEGFSIIALMLLLVGLVSEYKSVVP